MTKNDCLFCKIVAKQVPATLIYEDDVVLAFLDIGPISEGHTLVVPKQHFEKLHDCPPDVLEKICSRFEKIIKAIVAGTDCDGYNLLCNNGRAAGQLVEHLHFHIIPRRNADGVFDRWPSFKYPEGKANLIAEKIRSAL